MRRNNVPSDWYLQQANQAGEDLDLDLHMGACEAEIKAAINSSFEPMPEPEPKTDNSIYNLNALLDSI